MTIEELRVKFTEIGWREQPFVDAFKIREDLIKLAELYAHDFAITEIEKLREHGLNPTRDGYPVKWGPLGGYISYFEKHIDEAIKRLKEGSK